MSCSARTCAGAAGDAGHRSTGHSGDPFHIAPELDSDTPDSKQMAAAFAKSWSHDEATAVLRDMVEKLLEIGRRVPADEELDEEVSESVYVMF